MAEPNPSADASEAPPPRRPLILFDGVCNLCHGMVRWVVRRDTAPGRPMDRGTFDFASLQSQVAQRAVAEALGGDTTPPGGEGPASLPDAIVLIDGRRLLVKSDAVLAICERLRFPWPLLARVTKPLPRRLRDAVYDLVARRRHRWFGRRGACVVPSPGLEARFLDAAEWRSGTADIDRA